MYICKCLLLNDYYIILLKYKWIILVYYVINSLNTISFVMIGYFKHICFLTFGFYQLLSIDSINVFLAYKYKWANNHILI